MTVSRLTLALETGLLDLPEQGAIGVFNPPGDIDLGPVDADRVRAAQTFYPAHDQLRHRGVHVTATPEGDLAACLVFCHRSKPATLDLIRRAVEHTQTGGLVLIEGDKTAGIESIAKAVRKRFELAGSYSKSHGKLIWFNRPEALPDMTDWQAAATEIEGGFVTWPGIFSADRVDKGSTLLAHHLPALKGRVADLGAGWGYLSRGILESPDVTAIDLIEADFHALEAARKNIRDSRARFHWADATAFSGGPYDAIVSNPPFHTTRKADPALGQAFIKQAAKLLQPGGVFWMVANRNLPYEQTLAASFQTVDTVIQDSGFKVFRARKPKTSRPGR
ncbi:MAG: class I SAM-dependent methyltransferase [Paracoccaceae bacterium]